MSSSETDSAAYRRALGSFATGVAVVTAVDRNGEQVGITVNSFSSVSLDPPLVLWSVAKNALSFEAFVEAEHFAVNVLAVHQEDVCARFAKRGNNKFVGLTCHEGVAGVPILPEYSAVFECRTENVYPGGDHEIIVGRVVRFDDRMTDPLIFYRGRFLL